MNVTRKRRTRRKPQSTTSSLAPSSLFSSKVPEKLASIIEQEFGNKRVTRSMDQEAKKIKREYIRKERRRRNKQLIVIEISDDEDKEEKKHVNNNSKEHIKLISNKNATLSNNERDLKSKIRKIKVESLETTHNSTSNIPQSYNNQNVKNNIFSSNVINHSTDNIPIKKESVDEPNHSVDKKRITKLLNFSKTKNSQKSDSSIDFFNKKIRIKKEKENHNTNQDKYDENTTSTTTVETTSSDNNNNNNKNNNNYHFLNNSNNNVNN
ncbi:hypothetical protein BCR32DRAFT_241645 [Anaeromyces robustus]|uniref:Uncharacterized protein n=1 Tax=Anaeromyces robustus TaxID=1754192 RepID=A0A1Y1XIJ6_9FUNG|nr:hypothetical protein BCR32DRAFT_241645 [Anaeromyces robustus]|eukprot:ORX85579.1 hypothetical protein BCR32DRAFT_241645 [Anaeromyces robustus]